MMPSKLHTLIVVDSAPYGTLRCREALDMALAFAAFDQPVALLLRGMAVNWLRSNQSPDGIGQKNLARNLGAAPIYGIESVLAEAAALTEQGIEPASLPEMVTMLDSGQLKTAYDQAGQVLHF